MKGRPNLLYIFADQMRACDMACAGNPDVSTPNLDRLAAEGVRFNNATSCIPVCTPARACLLTGRFPLSTGMFLNDLQLSTRERSIAHVLADEDYETAYVGKWHLDGGNRWAFTPPGPRRQGFDHWHAINCDHRDYLDPVYYQGDSSDPVRPEVYATDWETDTALNCIDTMTGTDQDHNPWALVLSWSTPHNPYQQLPDRWIDSYDPATLELRANAADTEEHRRDLSGYYAHISALDEALGRLLDGLDQRGLTEDTIVVFTSDHGDMLGSHGAYRKQWPWDESALVPLIVRWPTDLGTGETCDVPFSTEDTAPTLLSWMGLETPETMEGRDLTGAIAGHEAAPLSSVLMSITPFSENRGDAWRGVRTDRHTFVRKASGPWLLYDNLQDPCQLKNLVDDPACKAIRSALEKELDRWLELLGDSFEAPEAYVRRYGYEVEAGNSAPHSYDLEIPQPLIHARRRDEL
jgi:arylsulfatase A-like enzyme